MNILSKSDKYIIKLKTFTLKFKIHKIQIKWIILKILIYQIFKKEQKNGKMFSLFLEKPFYKLINK